MRILFTVIPEKGHLNPYIPVAQALQRAGHVVAFHAGADIRPQLSAAGLDLFLGNPAQPEPPAASRGKDFAERIRDRDWLRQWIKMLLIDMVPETIEPLRAQVREFSPDVIVTDPMLYQSVIVAEQEGLPWTAVSNSLNPVLNEAVTSELLDTVAWLSAAREELFAGQGVSGIRFKGCDSLSPHGTVCFTTPEFVGEDVSGVVMPGPSKPQESRGDETDFSWTHILSGKKKVFASFGSQIYYQPERFNKIIEAFRQDKDVQLFLSVGELLDTREIGSVPDHIIVSRYVPQVRLLDSMDVFITHGGANSVMEGMSAGVPVLVAPICNDQFHQAWFVKNAGVGDELPLETMEPKDIRESVHRVMNNNNVQENVRRVTKSYEADGASITAGLIERMAG